MSDIFEGISPHISDRYITSEIAGEALTMGQVVAISADQTVKKPTVNPSYIRCGICMTSAAINKRVSVLWRGRARATAYGTIIAGDWVGSGPGGTIQTITSPMLGSWFTSAGTAAMIAAAMGEIGSCEIGAVSGGTAIILIN